jgi:hypothetical protein
MAGARIGRFNVQSIARQGEVNRTGIHGQPGRPSPRLSVRGGRPGDEDVGAKIGWGLTCNRLHVSVR